jgi:acyl carrier protein
VQGHEETHSSTPSANPHIEFLRRLWAEALDVPSVGLDEDFFALGGDSLAVARIVVTAAAEGVAIEPNLFIQYRTIRELANAHAPG